MLQEDDALILHDQLLKMGLEKWWPSDPDGECGIRGSAVFHTFQHAFDVLVKKSSLKCKTFQHCWYADWFWIGLKHEDVSFFNAVEAELNDNVIREITKYLDPLHLVYFATINERFNGLAVSPHIRIFPSTVGTIGLMNFRFILEKFGSSVVKISLSLISFNCFPFCFSHNKYLILNIIYWFSGPLLKKIQLYDFDVDESETEKINIIVDLFDQRGIEVKFNSK